MTTHSAQALHIQHRRLALGLAIGAVTVATHSELDAILIGPAEQYGGIDGKKLRFS